MSGTLLTAVIKKSSCLNFQKTENVGTVGNDTRITRIGIFIQKYKIDELPELFDAVLDNTLARSQCSFWYTQH